MTVTIEGALWVCGHGAFGQLGLGDEDTRLTPTLVGAQMALGGSQVLTVACDGGSHAGRDQEGSPMDVWNGTIWRTQPQRPQQQAGADEHQGAAHLQHQYLLSFKRNCYSVHTVAVTLA